jgi:hypothetical protein
VYGYLASRYAVQVAPLTARELPPVVAPELRELLIPLETERYARAPDAARIESSGARARAWLDRVARGE